jgi:P4 family phage/plasmid primase-like protien
MYSRNIRTGVEAMAYTFERDYTIEVIFMLHGLGANGRTVYTSTMTKLHGPDNGSNVPLSEMLGDRFALSDLENKDFNIDNELAGQTIREAAVLKRLTGGSRQRIRIQRKNQRAYDTIIHAKLFFNANKIPISADTSDACNRRVIIISFPYRFEGDKADKFLISKLTTEDEISGIFNVLMNALRHIRKTKDIYVDEKTIEEKRIKYERTVNPIKTFIDEAVSEYSTVETVVTKKELFDAYEIYCKKYTLPIEKYDTFCRRVKNFRFDDDDRAEIKETRRDVGEKDKDGNVKKTQCWVGVVLNPEYKQEEEQQRLV